MYVCMCVCMYVCMYGCMCVCMCVCIYVCMYITAFASISRTAFEIEALSFAVNRFRKKTKEHSEQQIICDWKTLSPGEILFRIASHAFARDECECK